MLEWWQALLSGAAGGFLALVGQTITGLMQSSRERKAREAERETARSDRRNEFELERLIQARDALREALRLAQAEHFFLVNEFPGRWHATLDPRPSEEARPHIAATIEALGLLQSAMVLILDDDARKAVKRAHSALSSYKADHSAAEDRVGEALDRIGARVRTLYGELG